jgi:hypothetical protein
MKYSFSLLDKTIEKIISRAYSKSPNKKYLVNYLSNRYFSSNNLYEKITNKSIKKITEICYHHYSLGNYTDAQSIFSSDDNLCSYFTKGELNEYINSNLIVVVKIYENQKEGGFTPPSRYKITDEKFKMEIYKACKDIIISKEMLRKVKELPEYDFDEIATTISVEPRNKNKITQETLLTEKNEVTNNLELGINVFCKEMPLSLPINFFKIFNLKNSKNNNKPFLSQEQLNLFIRKAFNGEKNIEKIKFNQAAKGEKLLIQYVFYKFYLEFCDDYFGTLQKQQLFINLLADNFIGWNSKSLSKKFKPDIKSKQFNEFELLLDRAKFMLYLK